MKYYENVVIFDALLSDDEINAQIEKAKAAIEQSGLKMMTVDTWGRRRLAYPINKRRDGYYVIFYFTSDSDKNPLTELDRKYRLTESILRHMFVYLSQKDAAIVLKDYFKSEKKESAEPSEPKEESKPKDKDAEPQDENSGESKQEENKSAE